jgi:hypothetical protein
LLRVESQEVEGERLGGFPPGLLGPTSIESLDLQIDGDLGSLETPKAAGLTKLAPQLAIGAFQQGEPERPKPAPQAEFRQSEVITLTLFGQWGQFRKSNGRFTGIHRITFERHSRSCPIAASSIGCSEPSAMRLPPSLCFWCRHCKRPLKCSTAVTGDADRRGLGWVAGQANIGWSHRIGWYEGFHLLLCVTAQGVMIGFGEARASTHDQRLTATLLAARQTPSPRLPSAGLPVQGLSLADKGFAGERPRRHRNSHQTFKLVCMGHNIFHPHFPR